MTKNKKQESRETLFNATFFASMYMYDANKKLRNPLVTTENKAMIDILQYCRYFAIKNVSSLEYMVIAIHNHDLVTKDSKETDSNGDPKYKKGDTKSLHAHVAMKFQRNQGKTQSAVAKQFYKALNVKDTPMQIDKNQKHVEITANEGAMLHYLTHTNQPSKTPYGLQNLMIIKVSHRKKGKVKYVIDEDFKEVKDASNVRDYWVTELNDNLYLGDGGKEKRYEEPQFDNFDIISKTASAQGLKWQSAGRSFGQAECRLSRQSGNATKWFLDYRSKFDSKQALNVFNGAKSGGSKFYHGKLPLVAGKNHETTEIQQICSDLQDGKIKYYQVLQTLKDDFGAQGGTAWDRYKNTLFTEAVSDWVAAKVSAIGDITKPDKRQLSFIYTTGDGGSGKDYYTGVEQQLLTGVADAHRMTTGGKKKTPDLYKDWGNRLHSIGSDVDGKSFDCHEFTQVFDTDKGPTSASGRNNNSPYLPNFVWMNNATLLRDFVTDSMTHSNRELYAKSEEKDNGTKSYDYGALNDYKQTRDMKVQMMRRIPYYQQFVSDAYDNRWQRCRLFFYVKSLDEHVLFDEFKCRKLNTIEDDSARLDEALRVANRLANDIKQYDFAGFFGPKKKLPYSKLLTVYDFDSESIKRISPYKVFNDAINEYHRVNRIKLTDELTASQERDLFSGIKLKAQKTYSKLVSDADFSQRDLMDKCKFYIDVLSNYHTKLERQESIIADATSTIYYADFLKTKMNDKGFMHLPSCNQVDQWIANDCFETTNVTSSVRNVMNEFDNGLRMALDGHKSFVDVANAQGFHTMGYLITKSSCDFVIDRLMKLIESVRNSIDNDGIKEQIALDFSNGKYLPVAGVDQTKNVAQIDHETITPQLRKQLLDLMEEMKSRMEDEQSNQVANSKIG